MKAAVQSAILVLALAAAVHFLATTGRLAEAQSCTPHAGDPDCVSLPEELFRSVTIDFVDEAGQRVAARSADRPEDCPPRAWCASVDTYLSEVASGRQAGIEQAHTYVVDEPIPGSITLIADRGTLDLGMLSPGRLIGQFSSAVQISPGQLFRLCFDVLVVEVDVAAQQASFVLQSKNTNSATTTTLNYDVEDEEHSYGILFDGVLIALGDDAGFFFETKLVAEPCSGLRAVEDGDLIGPGFSLPFSIRLLSPDLFPAGEAPYRLPAGGLLNVETRLSQVFDPGVAKDFEHELVVSPVRANGDFRRGDSDGDGTLGLSDAVATLASLFLGGAQPDCPDAADFDDDGSVDLTDAVSTLNYLFLSGFPPLAPGLECRPDPTEDGMEKCEYRC